LAEKFLETLLRNDWLVLQARKRKKTLVYTKGRDKKPSTRSTKANKSRRTHVTKDHNNEDTTNTVIK
jgi:hypothetical protein